jgi:hypothetical protein
VDGIGILVALMALEFWRHSETMRHGSRGCAAASSSVGATSAGAVCSGSSIGRTSQTAARSCGSCAGSWGRKSRGSCSLLPCSALLLRCCELLFQLSPLEALYVRPFLQNLSFSAYLCFCGLPGHLGRSSHRFSGKQGLVRPVTRHACLSYRCLHRWCCGQRRIGGQCRYICQSGASAAVVEPGAFSNLHRGLIEQPQSW